MLQSVVHEKVFKRDKRLFAQSFSLKYKSRKIMNQRIRAFHSPNIFMIQLKCYDAIKVNFFAVTCRERVPAPPESQNLLLLFLPGEL